MQASAASGGKTLSRQITLTVTPPAEIDAKPDAVDFAVKTGQSARVTVSIDNPGKDPWKFRAEYAPKNRPLAKVSVVATGGAAAEVNLQEAGLEPVSDGTNNEVSVLRILPLRAVLTSFEESDDRDIRRRNRFHAQRACLWPSPQAFAGTAHNLGSNWMGANGPQRHFPNAGCIGFKSRLDSTVTIALGTSSPTLRLDSSQSSPIAWVNASGL